MMSENHGVADYVPYTPVNVNVNSDAYDSLTRRKQMAIQSSSSSLSSSSLPSIMVRVVGYDHHQHLNRYVCMCVVCMLNKKPINLLDCRERDLTLCMTLFAACKVMQPEHLSICRKSMHKLCSYWCFSGSLLLSSTISMYVQ